jgi:hypothetical protein
MKEPSIDRIDKDKDYFLENCRYIELSENKRKEWFENGCQRYFGVNAKLAYKNKFPRNTNFWLCKTKGVKVWQEKN